jgi:predicted glycoside hydrolase/deacetylase ChbG (UPF0249 family)
MKNYNNELISIIIPAKNASNNLEKTLNTLFEYFNNETLFIYEVILVINNSSADEIIRMENISSKMKPRFPNFKYFITTSKGKGEAVQFGFHKSNGEIILFTDADLPYSLNFFSQAIQQIFNGASFVTGNRRHPESTFKIKFPYLKKTISRNNKSSLFNFIAKKVLDIKTLDTQAGIKAFNRQIGEFIFSRNSCPGFLFDLEFFLSCKTNYFKHEELPVTLHVHTEESTVNLVKELPVTLKWLAIFYIRTKQGYYQKREFNNNFFITADDWGMSPSINKGILELAKKGIVKKVSILASADYAHYYLDELKSLPDVELGLHLNLTFNSICNSPKELLIHSLNPFLFNKISKRVYLEFQKQYEDLLKFDVNIKYIDGHHHCHIFPRVATIFLAFLKEKNISHSRMPLCWKSFLPNRLILIFLSLLQKNKFKKNGIICNPFYYPDFEKIHSKENFLKKVESKEAYEIIVHPSSFDDFEMFSIGDDYNFQRVKEYEILQNLAN